jgi:NADH-quinone oxidoreductase subunit D
VATTFERPVGEPAARLDPSVLRGPRIYEGTRIPSPTPSIMTVPPELAATGDVLQVNFGPNHPSTHGVLRLVVDLNGEEVVGLRAVVGYLHTGFEKNMEAKSWWKAITYGPRIDYVAFQNNELVFVLAIEKLLGLEIPEKAQWMRMCLAELNRIHSHLIWIGTMALEIGAISMFWYAFRERDLVLDLFEMVTGYRMHTRYFQVGGLAEDIPAGFYTEARAFCEWMPKAVDDYEGLLDRNAIWLERTQGLGLLSAEDAVAMGQSGPVLRASGVDWDLRRETPYLAYDQVDFDVPVYVAGDVYDRYRVRMDEMRQSVRIVAQCVDRLEDMEGLPWIADDRKVVLPPRTELHTSMESLIHHFKIVTEGYRVPEGEVYVTIEGPRGELGCYVVSDGGPRPWRVKFRAPSFVATATAPTIMQGALVADLIAIVGSLDTVMGEVDR